jgi:hypothetical protein
MMKKYRYEDMRTYVLPFATIIFGIVFLVGLILWNMWKTAM